MKDNSIKHEFRYGEETYTMHITRDDWWLEEPVDMSEGMIRAGNEFAQENGMPPSNDLCVDCRKGKYVDVVEDYHIAGTTIKNLDLHRCCMCGHTTLPWASVEKVDEALKQPKREGEPTHDLR